MSQLFLLSTMATERSPLKSKATVMRVELGDMCVVCMIQAAKASF